MVDNPTKNHIRLLVNNDLNRYDDIKLHLQRMAQTTSTPAVSSNTTYAGDAGCGEEDHDWQDEPWWDYASAWDTPDSSQVLE